MPDTLTQLVAKVQASLQDDGTLFSTATITAAARLALADINIATPEHAAVTITAVALQKEYELSDEDATANGITNVLLAGANELDVELAYDAYVEDDRWFFRLRTPQAAGETIIVHYTKPYTINGLDSATDSTLPDDLNTAAINGSCYYCCISRAARGTEANNVEPAVTANWLKLADHWRSIFKQSMTQAKRRPTAKGEPGQAMAWNDAFHSNEYP